MATTLGMNNIPKLGEMLAAKKLITQSQLETAMQKQKLDGRPLGEILLEDHAISHRQLRRTLNLQQWLRKAAMIASIGAITLQCVQANDWNGYSESKSDTWFHGASQSLNHEVGLAEASVDHQREQKNYQRSKSKWHQQVKDVIGEPAYILLRGQYSGNANEVIEGLNYTVKWRSDSVKIQFSYSF